MSSNPTTNFSVRSADSTNAAEIARIYNHYVRIGGATFDVAQWPPEQVARLLERESDAWFVAVASTGLLGWASARQFSERYGYRYSCETAIYIDSDSIGTGVADALQKQIENHCCEAGIHHAVAKIVADNERSMNFHKRFGYEIVGIQKEIGRVGDAWVDVAILQKIFSNS